MNNGNEKNGTGRLARAFLLLSIAFTLVGCRSLDGIANRFPSVTDEPSAPASIQLAASLGAPDAATADLTLVSAQEKTNTPAAKQDDAALGLTLQAALEQSLNANPDLVTLRGQVNVNWAMVNVAQTYPWNPFVQAQYFPNGRPLVRSSDPGGGAGQSNYYVWAMQRFELAHQTKFRKEIALATLTQVEWNIQQAELNAIAQTMRLYFAALYQKELYDLAAEALDVQQKLAEVVDRRFKANLAKAAEVTTTKVALRQAKRQTELAQATYQASLLALRQQLNVPMQTGLLLPVKFADYRWNSLSGGGAQLNSPGTAPNDLAHLANELVEGRPDVMAAQAGIAISDANHRLAKAARVPDISAGPIYETGDDGTKYLGVRLQMDIPVFNNGTPLVRQREAEARQQTLMHQQLKVRASLEAQSSLNRYERAIQLLIQARAETSSQSVAVSDDMKEIARQFQSGQADILAVIAVQNTLIQERRAFLDLLNELGQAAAGVVQTTALPLNRVIANVERVLP